MPQFISITRAAILANVQARDIQEKIDSKQLASTRGKIHTDDLINCYPDANIDEVDMVSLVERIKEQSFEAGAAKQHGEQTLSALKEDLVKYRTNSKYYHEQADKYEDLIAQIKENLLDMQSKELNQKRIQRLLDWIDKKLGEVRRND